MVKQKKMEVESFQKFLDYSISSLREKWGRYTNDENNHEYDNLEKYGINDQLMRSIFREFDRLRRGKDKLSSKEANIRAKQTLINHICQFCNVNSIDDIRKNMVKINIDNEKLKTEFDVLKDNLEILRKSREKDTKKNIKLGETNEKLIKRVKKVKEKVSFLESNNIELAGACSQLTITMKELNDKLNRQKKKYKKKLLDQRTEFMETIGELNQRIYNLELENHNYRQINIQ